MTTIRRAGAADVAQLARLNAEVHAAHVSAEPHVYRATVISEVEQWLGDALQRQDARILLAERAGRMVGYVVVRVIDVPSSPFKYARRVARVDQLAVIAADRGHGCGTALMHAAEGVASEARCVTVELDVRAFNLAASGFYRRLGYRAVGERLSRDIAIEHDTASGAVRSPTATSTPEGIR